MNENELKGCRKLALAVLAKSLVDLLNFALANEDDKSEWNQEYVDSAIVHVLEYKGLAKRLKTVKSKREIKRWIRKLNKELNR